MLMMLVGLADQISALNVFRYITFRTGGALITSALIVFMYGPMIIDSLRLRQGKGQPIRADGPQTHFKKAGTPTMGGLMMLVGIVGGVLLWGNLSSPLVWVVMLVTLSFGAIGFYDDYLKVTKQTHAGFGGKARLMIEVVIAVVACYLFAKIGIGRLANSVAVPFFKDVLIDDGMQVYESTNMERLEDHTVYTHAGSITADHIIVAVDKLEPHISPLSDEVFHAQTFLSVTEPLTDREFAILFPSGEQMQCWDSKLVYTYFRLTKDNRLLLGGGSAVLNNVIGRGAQVLGPIRMQECRLEDGGSHVEPDPDRRGGVLKGAGVARGLSVPRGGVIQAFGTFEAGALRRQVEFHPKR